EQTQQWTGEDVPDFPVSKPPDYQPSPDAQGMDAHPGDAPFLMQRDGLGWLFAPEGVIDGPLPTHYEPLESPVRNALYPQQSNPMANWFHRPENPFAKPGDSRFPHVLTTYRLTEHQTGGGMTRFVSRLAELQPELFVEISPELAGELNVANGDWIAVVTPRGGIEARAMVTRRLRPLQIAGRTVHQVAVPFHWGYAGPSTGDVANDLTPMSGEPNVAIHESKALVCVVIPGRIPTGEDHAAWLEKVLG
ncbi:MAG: formate dehydrogenase subunit alpha, partial [Planctomycetales bacterium]